MHACKQQANLVACSGCPYDKFPRRNDQTERARPPSRTAVKLVLGDPIIGSPNNWVTQTPTLTNQTTNDSFGSLLSGRVFSHICDPVRRLLVVRDLRLRVPVA